MPKTENLQITNYNCRGSMLLNLVLTLAIFAIISAISAPTLRQYQPNLKLRAESKKLISDLRYTQELTVAEQNTHYLEINSSSSEYSIVKQTEPSSPIKTVGLDAAISIQQVSGFDNDRIVFNSYGAVSQAGTIILVNSQNKTSTINVKPSGYVQLEQ